MFIITIDRPFYPSVEYCETYDDAKSVRDELIEENETGGIHNVSVVIAEIKETIKIKTDF